MKTSTKRLLLAIALLLAGFGAALRGQIISGTVTVPQTGTVSTTVTSGSSGTTTGGSSTTTSPSSTTGVVNRKVNAIYVGAKFGRLVNQSAAMTIIQNQYNSGYHFVGAIGPNDNGEMTLIFEGN